jgi:superfamily II DNA or RNA helicase
MQDNPFQDRTPNIAENSRLREPQQGAFAALSAFAANPGAGEREVGIVLPVGCGKSGCITLTPFAFKATRTLVIAPNVPIALQLEKDFDPASPDNFYLKCTVLDGPPYPEIVDIRGTTTNRSDLEEADVVITNIHQLQGAANRWLEGLPDDFFDLIQFDEGHHNVAASWETLRGKFPRAKIVNFSATPTRADGQLMAGRILYSYPIYQAIQKGYIKRLKAVVLNPRTLRYVRREDGQEIEVSLEEVRQLGEQDANFRRSIVTSTETLNTIVDASIQELEKLRAANGGDKRLKIIASALNYEHCGQIVAAYRSKNRHADYVHSREVGAANDRVMKKLENHELDVIVQVRKLGEGFDHRYLAVAAVFSIFGNLSPFVQFVGRIMRVIKMDAPGDPLNNGVVVFHAGANIARRWEDFQEYSEADREYFDQLLPMEGLDFSQGDEIQIDPVVVPPEDRDQVDVRSQTDVRLEEIPLIKDDPAAMAALKLLQQKGYSPDQVKEAYQALQSIPATKVRIRRAKRSKLDMKVINEAAHILFQRGINPEGQTLDQKTFNKSNLIVMKSAIDRQVAAAVGRKLGRRSDYTGPELDQIELGFGGIVARAIQEVFGGAN